MGGYVAREIARCAPERVQALAVIEGSGHMVPFEKAAELIAAIVPWLTRIENS